MSLVELAIICIFALSVFANVCYAIFNKQLAGHFSRWDNFRWISLYRLFSKTPRHYKLFFKDISEAGDETDWIEIPLVVPKRRYHFLVFPENHVPIVIYSYMDDLARATRNKISKDTVTKSFHFQTVLRFVWRFQGAVEPSMREFRIKETSGHLGEHESIEVFTSGFQNRCTFP